jgi:rhodanese-related sulfurtransferase
MLPNQDQDPAAGAGAAPSRIRELNAPAIKSLVAFGTPLIDIRDARAYASGHIPGSVQIAPAELQQRLPELLPRRDRAVAVVGAGENDSMVAAQELQDLGYTAVVCLRGGLRSWPDQLQEGQAAAA